MAQIDLVQPVAVAATSQVKLCSYDENHISGSASLRPSSPAAGIRSQKLKYANAIAFGTFWTQGMSAMILISLLII